MRVHIVFQPKFYNIKIILGVDYVPAYNIRRVYVAIFLFILFGGILFAIFFKFIKLPSKFIEKAIGLGCVVGLLSGIYFVSM